MFRALWLQNKWKSLFFAHFHYETNRKVGFLVILCSFHDISRITFTPHFHCDLYRFWLHSGRPQPSFLHYLPCEIKVFRIRPSRTIKANIGQFVVKMPSKMEPKPLKNRFKPQSTIQSDFEAKNARPMGSKMKPGTTWKRLKTRPKNIPKNV